MLKPVAAYVPSGATETKYIEAFSRLFIQKISASVLLRRFSCGNSFLVPFSNSLRKVDLRKPIKLSIQIALVNRNVSDEPTIRVLMADKQKQ